MPTDLHFAVFMGQKDVIAALPASQLETKDANGFTLLHTAIERNKPEIAEFLIKRGVNVNAKTNDGYTPLIAAVAGAKSAQLTALLLDNGADINLPYKGKTPLAWATGGSDNQAVVDVLKKYGAK